MMLVTEKTCKIACKMITFHNILENNLSCIDFLFFFSYFFIPPVCKDEMQSFKESYSFLEDLLY